MAELTPHLLSRCALFPLVLVVLSLDFSTFVHLVRPDVDAVPSILAYLVHLTFPEEIRLAILSACPRALAITADLDADTSRFSLFSKMSITNSVALARTSVTNHAGPAWPSVRSSTVGYSGVLQWGSLRAAHRIHRGVSRLIPLWRNLSLL